MLQSHKLSKGFRWKCERPPLREQLLVAGRERGEGGSQ